MERISLKELKERWLLPYPWDLGEEGTFSPDEPLEKLQERFEEAYNDDVDMEIEGELLPLDGEPEEVSIAIDIYTGEILSIFVI